MIAPIRPQQPRTPQMSEARRTVGELFLRPRSRSSDSDREISRRATWLVLGWVALVAVVYLVRGRH